MMKKEMKQKALHLLMKSKYCIIVGGRLQMNVQMNRYIRIWFKNFNTSNRELINSIEIKAYLILIFDYFRID